MPRDRALLDWLQVERGAVEPLHDQIGRQLRDAVRDGRLLPGTFLPSSRRLAADLAVSRGTITAIYDRLLGEGVLQVSDRSATFVAETPSRPVETTDGPPHHTSDSPVHQAPPLEDDLPPPYPAFVPGIPAYDIFPAARWARLLRARSYQMTQELADSDAHIGGFRPLRRALADHLRTARGVLCDAEQVIIASSARAALVTACRLVAKAGDRAIVEDPGYPIARRVMAGLGLEVVPVPVDSGGAMLEPPLPAARLVYVTPTHQMPLGMRLSADRCRSLVEWTRTADAWVIEDDYDSEFRYAAEPVVALQHLDPNGRMLHIGTFSKTLFPSLRVAYLVVPTALAKTAGDQMYLFGHEPTLHVQAALADFIREGHYAAHIRRSRSVYRRRQGLLVEALNHHLAGDVSVSRPVGGMHVVVPLPPEIPAWAVQRAAAREGLHARSIAFYADRLPAPNALHLGFAGVLDRQIEPAVARLAAAVRSVAAGPVKLS